MLDAFGGCIGHKPAFDFFFICALIFRPLNVIIAFSPEMLQG